MGFDAHKQIRRLFPTGSSAIIRPCALLKKDLGEAAAGQSLAQERREGRYSYGSAASLRPSPKKLKASTVTITGTMGSSSQG